MNEDAKLLLRYAQEHSEAAFAELVRRHVDLVYSAALRRCAGDTHRAEDVVQQVFTSLARGAKKLAGHPALGAWLYAATRNAATNLWIADQRRLQREHDAVMSGLLSAEDRASDWSAVRPVLDEAMDELSETDRTAVLMRFFERRSFAEIGTALNASENTARMRTERSLEKLRLLLVKRGVRSTAIALGMVLSQQAVTAAPARHVAVLISKVLSGVSSSGRSVGTGIHFSLKKLLLLSGALAVATSVGFIVYHASVTSLTGPGAETAATERTDSEGRERTLPQPVAAQSPGASVKTERSQPALRPGPRATPTAKNAEQILQKMAAAYAALYSYQDSGEVSEKNTDGKSHQKVTFRTFFRRSDQFRFDWIHTRSSFIVTQWTARIWTEGKRAFFSWSLEPNSVRQFNLDSAILVHTGVSLGSSVHVPCFFLDDKDRARIFSLAGLQAPLLVEEEEVEGTLCYVIKGQHPNSSPYELWIGENDFLLRKISTVWPLSLWNKTERSPGPNLQLEEIHREIRINGDVSSKF
jgi:RNA polymerase sigma factor (sigma-70 family)